MRAWFAAALLVAGCATAGPPPPAPPAPALPAPVPPPVATAAPPASPPQSVYGAEEAIRDALASPLTLVGIGGYPGYFRHLSCIHRNAQVIVVDMRCNDPETYQLKAIIYSPTRGLVQLIADARQTKAAVSTLRREDYELFEVSGSGPWTGPAPLTLSMSYDELTAYEEQRSMKQGGCQWNNKMPQPVCVRSFTPAAFAAANQTFLTSPPDSWYQLAHALVAARHGSYAAVDVTRLTPKQLAAWAGAIGFKNDVDVAENALPFVGQPGRFAPVVTVEDGMAYVGARRAAAVVVKRTDRTGSAKWELVMNEPGIREESDTTSLVATSDGFVVHAMGYTNPGLKGRHRLVKLDTHGKVLWRWHPPDHGAIAIPQFFRAGLTPQGTVLIDGYVQTEHDGPVLGWTAEVSADGKTLREEVGSAELGKKNSMP